MAVLEQRDAALEERVGVLRRRVRRVADWSLIGAFPRAGASRQRRAAPGRSRAPGPPRPPWCCAARAARRVRPDDRDLVLIGVEADVGARDVVHDDRVERLALELRPRALDALRAVLGREADDRSGPRGAAPPASASTSAVATRSTVRASRPSLEILRVARAARAGSRRPRRPSAAGRTSAKRCERRVAQLARRSRRPRTRRRACASSDVWPRSRSRAAPRRAASAASAKPIRPLERLPTKRTASSGSRVPPAVTSTRMPSSGRGAPVPATISIASQDRGRLGEAADPPLAARGERPGAGLDHVHAARRAAASRFACVAGCSYMWLFIAGATSTGLAQAR